MAAKILFFDIETAPMEVFVWGLGEQHVGIEQIKKDWHLMSFSAKWADQKKVIYHDQRRIKDVSDDGKLLKNLHALLDEAEIVVTQNGKKFDSKKANARFIQQGLTPPSPYKHLDVLNIKRKVFAFTSNKLAYTSEILNKEHKKLTHKKFPGLELWKECLRGNLAAWKEMEKYNKMDVLALEEEYLQLRSWDSSVSIALDSSGCRSCGGFNLQRRGFDYTTAGKQQRFQCQDCMAWCKSGENSLSAGQRSQIKRKV